jgi:hypothetical protein
MNEVTIDLAGIVSRDGLLPGETRHFLDRETGRKAREAMAEFFADSRGETVFYIDFSGVGVIDYSCADELLGKLLPRILADEFGRKYICLKNVNNSQAENISVALEKRNLAVVAIPRGGGWMWLGKLIPYLQETLDLVYDHRRISARELSSLLRISLNNGSTRLINLYKQRLVGRRENVNGKGFREFIYTSLAGGFGIA